MGHYKAVVFDWAGTIIDYGCWAPTSAFIDFFGRFGIVLTPAEINPYMGQDKKTHLQSLLKDFKEDELKNLDQHYLKFKEILLSSVASNSKTIPGALHAVRQLRWSGMKIGSSTGYPREVMNIIQPLAAKQGYTPDCVVTADEVVMGRPSPAMCYANSVALNIPMSQMIKVGDTLSDIQAGKNAGAATIGIVMGGNLFGYTRNQVDSATAKQLAVDISNTKSQFYAAGATAVATSIMEVPLIVKRLDKYHGHF